MKLKRTSLPELAKLEAPLRALLEYFLRNTRRTEHLAARHAICSKEWEDEHTPVWDAVRLRVAEAVPLYHLKQRFSVMMFPDASDKFWGSASPRFRLAGWRAALQLQACPMSCWGL